MKRLALLGALVLLIFAVAVPATAKKADAPGQNKTWVCHATNSATNSWILVHVANGWDEGHGNGGPAKHQDEDNELTGINPGEKLKAGPIDPDLIDAATCTFIEEEDEVD